MMAQLQSLVCCAEEVEEVGHKERHEVEVEDDHSVGGERNQDEAEEDHGEREVVAAHVQEEREGRVQWCSGRRVV